MANNHILDKVLGQGSRLALLRDLYFARGPLSGRGAASLARLSPRAGHLSLANLVKLGLVSQTAKGNKLLFILNRENPLVKSYLSPLFEYERNQEMGLKQGFPGVEPEKGLNNGQKLNDTP